MHHHFRQQRQRRLELMPNPSRQIFTSRILKPRNIVQIPVIESLVQRFERACDIGEILYPTGFGSDRTAHAELDAERMSVKPPAFVGFRHVRQTMSRFDSKDLEYFHEQ